MSRSKDIFKKIRNLPITLYVTIWYTFFIAIILISMVASSFYITDHLVESVSEKKLVKSVSEISDGHDDFEPFDDGIFYIKYKGKRVIDGSIPSSFDENIPFGNSTIQEYENKKENKKYIYYDRVSEYGNGKGKVWIRGVVPITTMYKTIGLFPYILTIFSILVILVVVIGGYKIIKNAFKPVRIITDTASEIGKSRDFSRRIEIKERKDEIHNLAKVFNEMLDSLEKTYIREKQFSSDVSHELRTPVSVILAESQYAGCCKGDEEEVSESIDVIKRQAERMKTLINQVMEISKMDAIESLILEDINISEEIETMVDDYRNYFEINKINLICNIEKGIYIKADRELYRRMVSNILSNAFKFTDNTVKVSVKKEKENCIISIEDNGEGISEDNIEKIWDRFYQEDLSRNKENNKGLGLGLSFVKEIARLHKSQVYVDSKAGEGTEFTIISKLDSINSDIV